MATEEEVVLEEGGGNVEEEETEEGAATSAAGGTHWKDLDPKGMKVIELRSELDARGLSTKGVKTVLAERLQKSLDEEKQKESEASSLGFLLTTRTTHVFLVSLIPWVWSGWSFGLFFNFLTRKWFILLCAHTCLFRE